MSYPFVHSHYPPGCSGAPEDGAEVPCIDCGQPAFISDPENDRQAKAAVCDRCLEEEAADRRLAAMKEG